MKQSAWQTLEAIEPTGLAVVLGGQHTGVEEDHDDNEPVEQLGFDDSTTQFTTATVEPV